MRNSSSGKPGTDIIAQEIPDPPPERDRGLRAPGEEATPVFSAKLSIPPPPPAESSTVSDER
ncbi:MULTISPECIES: hypothetical protein [Myxococcus]|uniref:hypothetical protein n=1 Tax=Myxococcus TaxID=32 RepID=UPI0013D4710A|nr:MULTISPECIES: hypothetical protein [Myxococcus]NVJ23494.1 hypothetical protein [Myxococcus sp. AM011]